MTKAEKTAAIEELKEKFSTTDFFYVTDASTLTVEQVTKLRRMLFEKGIQMQVVKNTLAIKALEALPEDKNYAGLFEALKGPTALMFTEVANAPARVIKQFRESSERPLLKAAYIDTAIFTGDEQLDTLAKLKSKEELLGEIIGLLQSPMANLLGSLQSGGQTLMGLLKTLEEREG